MSFLFINDPKKSASASATTTGQLFQQPQTTPLKHLWVTILKTYTSTTKLLMKYVHICLWTWYMNSIRTFNLNIHFEPKLAWMSGKFKFRITLPFWKLHFHFHFDTEMLSCICQQLAIILRKVYNTRHDTTCNEPIRVKQSTGRIIYVSCLMWIVSFTTPVNAAGSKQKKPEYLKNPEKWQVRLTFKLFIFAF